ncbi:MAG: hypothetical protein IPN42_10755 [Methylococcaceae bacterium]|nr:hypothetical protein [Methylococcaceae bacterium]
MRNEDFKRKSKPVVGTLTNLGVAKQHLYPLGRDETSRTQNYAYEAFPWLSATGFLNGGKNQ